MRLRFTISAGSISASKIPSPSRKGATRFTPSGEIIALWQPPEIAFRSAGSGVTALIWSSVSQPVALTTKQPDSAAW